MDDIKENFCHYLLNWKNKYFDGTQKELGEKFGVSQSLIAKTLSGERWGTEQWRRDVAKKIGIKYEVMIGIEKPEEKYQKTDLTPKFKKHIEKFKDKTECLIAISNLRKIEEIDEIAFIRMVAEIKATAHTIKKRKEKNQSPSRLLIDEVNTPTEKNQNVVVESEKI